MACVFPAPSRGRRPGWGWGAGIGRFVAPLLGLLASACACSASERADPVVFAPPPPPAPASAMALPAEPPATPLELVTLKVEDPGRRARRTLIDVGVPLPEGLELTRIEGLALKDEGGRWLPIQVTPRMRWGGVPLEATGAPLRWVGLRFFADLPAGRTAAYTLCYGGLRPRLEPSVILDQTADRLVIDTGPARFSLRRDSPDLFEAVTLDGKLVIGPGNGVFLTDRAGRRYRAAWHGEGLEIEARGPLEAVVTLRGNHVPVEGAGRPWLEFELRMRFQAGQPGVVLEHTLRNPDPALHPDNIWTLGSAGSALIDAATLELPVPGAGRRYALSLEGGAPLTGRERISLLQASSGRPGWRSVRHQGARGEVLLPFRGYRVTGPGLDGRIEGRHAQPALSLVGEGGGVTAALEHFWQNFPKGLEARDGRLLLHLFPPGLPGPHELQGGEQKTHRVQVWLEPSGASSPEARLIEMPRLWPTVPPEWWLAARASFQADRPRGPLKRGGIEATLETTIRPMGSRPGTMAGVADRLDAYGWREFGDVQADHETACGRPAGGDFISHYNNQYDYVLGAFHQFGRTGDLEYLDFALRTASHTADIDVYHTRGDRVVYNGGMFWHTTHDTPAGTSAHRSFPSRALSGRCTSYQSGGPGLGHLYLEGLVTAWAFTGDRRMLETALELGDFALNRRAHDKTEADGRALGNYLRSLVTLCEATGAARFCQGADAIVPVMARGARDGGVGWELAMLGKALGRWLELDDARLALERRVTLPVAGGAGRGAELSRIRRTALEGLIALCDRVAAAELPQDVNRARFADLLAACLPYGEASRSGRWRERAMALVESLEREYWARGTYPNAKELAILLTNGGSARSIPDREVAGEQSTRRK